MSANREREFWTPEPLWRGETAVFLAGGPSLTQAIADRVRGAQAQGQCKVVAINSSCRLAPWADMLFFTDGGWYERHREVVRDWPGLVVSVSRVAKREMPDKVKRVDGQACPDRFPPLGHPAIRQGRSSGHTALSVGIAMGINRAVLLGYDMRLVDGRSHCHDEYRETNGGIYTEFATHFKGWNALARAAGVEVLNATPGSALTEFPFENLDAILEDVPCAAS